MLATMLVIGATVVAMRSGRPSTGLPPAHPATDSPEPPPPPHPQVNDTKTAITTKLVRRRIGAKYADTQIGLRRRAVASHTVCA